MATKRSSRSSSQSSSRRASTSRSAPKKSAKAASSRSRKKSAAQARGRKKTAATSQSRRKKTSPLESARIGRKGSVLQTAASAANIASRAGRKRTGVIRRAIKKGISELAKVGT